MKPETTRLEDHVVHAHGRICDLECRLEAVTREMHKLSTRIDSMLILTHIGPKRKPVKAKKKTYRSKL
ncbi:hypothetical protein UFOVP543_10 [uncultured Caudovirales phage]|uniref:Uncharacterized protein n=1 Tax=uncultured Caudovirales phage TaxID=2100421 RepID=A0A6J5MUT5_9CAUD|nr:hypothetical protein UFOVP543_10 [uncultured Caudovirales phage]CAB4163683.1 hypothetical protein UFOVP804_38 [uncultured Caudovirales phage]